MSRFSQENPPPELVLEIQERLADVCAGWPRERFEAMTARAAWLKFKYDRALTDSFRTMSLSSAASARFREENHSETGASGA